MSSAATLTPPVHATFSEDPPVDISHPCARNPLQEETAGSVSACCLNIAGGPRHSPQARASLLQCPAGQLRPERCCPLECMQCGLQDDHLVPEAPGAAQENALVERPRRFALPHGPLSVPQHILCDPSVSCGGMDPVGRLGGQPRRGTETLLFRPRSGLCKGASMHASPHAQLPDRALLRSCIRTC